MAALTPAILCLMTRAQTAAAKDPAPPAVNVILGQHAPELERLAATELCRYLDTLYTIKTEPEETSAKSAQAAIVLGSPSTNPLVQRALGADGWPRVTDQGIVLKRGRLDGKPALVVGGGSPCACLWAVYELVERWGVHYLLHGDALPERPGRFQLPDEDVVQEPVLRIRQWRVVNDFPNGPESWGMADYRPLLRQLAKLKFNRILLSTWPYQPFLHYEVRGIARRSATLWYDYHFPITPDMIGRHLFGSATEFWNPDLPGKANYAAFVAAGRRLLHNILADAHARGLECVMTVSLTEFPREFAPLLKNPQNAHQLGETGIVPGPQTPVDDPALTELATAVMRTTVNTYPELDYLALGMPEFRQWVGQYEQAWRSLDARHGIGSVRSLADVLAAAQRRNDYPGGAERAVAEVKGDLVALYFYDRLLNQLRVLQGTRRPDMKFIYATGAEELYPLLPRILPAGSETLSFVDYTPSRIVRRRDKLQDLPTHAIPACLIYTLEDDNVGLLPQLTTGSLSQLTGELIRHGWAGFSTRYWMIGGQDPCVAYLSRAAWRAGTAPEDVYRGQIRAVCGSACVEDMLTVFRKVEHITKDMEWHELGFAFAVPGMMMKHWIPEPMPDDLVEDRRGYQRALEAARRARRNAAAPGRNYADYWVGRLEFAVDYLNAVEAIRRAAIAEHRKDRGETFRQTETALEATRRALQAYVRVARDQSDRGAIAQLNEFVYRPLKARRMALEYPARK